ncbi:MAG: HEPN domain-containing protein [Syntrophobacteraceae bacterium]|jgi:hypothetical protein
MGEFTGKPLIGEWWEPNQPTKIFKGQLYLAEDNHGTLTLMGTSKVLSGLWPSWREKRTIFGKLKNQYPYNVTLFNAGLMRGPGQSSDENYETEAVFFTNEILIGMHVASKEESIVHGARIGITGLDEWYDKTGFSGTVALGPIPFGVESVNLMYKAIKSPFYKVGPTSTLRFCSRYSGPLFFENTNTKKFKMEEKTFIELNFKGAISINDLTREATIWQRFLTFGLQQATYPNDIMLSIGTEPDTFNVGLLTPGWSNTRFDTKHHGEPAVLFTFSKLGLKVGKYLRAWREKNDLIETVITLFMASYYLRAFTHVNLLMYLQALEVLHSILFNGSRFPDKGTKRITLRLLREAIPANIPKSLQKEIHQQIGLIGSVPLVDRLKHLYNLYPRSIRPLFPAYEDDMRLLKEARNFLTHYGDRKKLTKDFLSSRQLTVLTEKTKLFLEICILGAIGMNDGEISEFISGCEPYWGWQQETHH